MWVLETVALRLEGRMLRPLTEYHPLVLSALINHLPDELKRQSLAREVAWDEVEETGDPEWDEMNRALRAGVDPATLPSWS